MACNSEEVSRNFEISKSKFRISNSKFRVNKKRTPGTIVFPYHIEACSFNDEFATVFVFRVNIWLDQVCNGRSYLYILWYTR
jgi:hypothetical protein